MAETLPPGAWLPIAFAALMGISMLLYAVLDGFDLGVGILLRRTEEEAMRDRMVASIGPFWDANETWLVLGVGLLLVAFPKAHGMILTELYLPVVLMLAGLILRGVAFEFRAKAPAAQKPRWDLAFQGGSLVAAFAQGWMLGAYILGFAPGWGPLLFSLLCGGFVTAGYTLLGATWLIWRGEDALQRRAVAWARHALWVTVAGVVVVSIATPLASARIFDRWFGLPQLLGLAPIPVATAGLVLVLHLALRHLPRADHRLDWVPFAATIGIFVLCFQGLAYSFWPYVVPERLTIFAAASAPESLAIILVGALAVLPMILGYTVFVWRVFGGKAKALSYG
ncbi:cytochrome d ubiquinol oxidase subunit II [Paracraurococcus ruber]|uniref:Cytochrome BD ubiquinol oxidase subunit II n=1 Tax=Paracraurococcus ruber TaxID=77675 RepID=A0ABS1D2H4_9PROT|nr:cytochrome d ubiquinol oxidase subunit II [Paracraurococcus ruber]MBK1660989.1 cytochrome BD ubiquinol oxidase subunit II [Paracraurococcus ruber]TDG27140.1 cytochrome d ubiquinol oxidase subunit II [Paracraurococcus ruber]